MRRGYERIDSSCDVRRGGRFAAAHYFDMAWLACCFSLLMLGLTASLGAGATALFILPWGVLAVRKPSAAVASLIKNAPLLLLPGLAFLSVCWSQYPEASLRFSLQLIVTTIIGIWAGTLISPRRLVSAILAALTMIMTASLLADGLTSYREGWAMTGVFESKNQLAFFAVMQLLAALAVLCDRLQPATMRALGALALLMAPVCLVAAQSTGALVFSVPALAAFFALTSISGWTPGGRSAAVAVVLFIVAASVTAAAAFIDDFSEVLDWLGKDATLTGRTYLWQRARDFIEQSPLLGVGYQAFWVVGNPPAEELWEASFERSGAGFNFHNMYLNTAVELGYVGLTLFVVTLLWTAARLVRSIVFWTGPTVAYVTAIFVYVISTSFLEVSLLIQFQLGPVLFCVIWAHSSADRVRYAKRLIPAKRNAAPA